MPVRQLVARTVRAGMFAAVIAIPGLADAQTPLADRFGPAAARVTFAADNSCYPPQQRERLARAVEDARAVLTIPRGTKADKSYEADLVALIIQGGGRGQVVDVINAFQFFAQNVVDTIMVRCPDRLAAVGLTGTPPDPENWPEFLTWKNYLGTVAQQANTHSAEMFEIRYGGGETLNWAEVYFDNVLQRTGFAGATDFRPSHVEPILRLTPLVYHAGTENVISMFEVGANYYFFRGFAKNLNPVGFAMAVANPSSPHPFQGILDFGELEVGAVAHVRKLEVGALRGWDGEWKFISTVNMQIVRGFF